MYQHGYSSTIMISFSRKAQTRSLCTAWNNMNFSKENAKQIALARYFILHCLKVVPYRAINPWKGEGGQEKRRKKKDALCNIKNTSVLNKVHLRIIVTGTCNPIWKCNCRSILYFQLKTHSLLQHHLNPLVSWSLQQWRELGGENHAMSLCTFL